MYEAALPAIRELLAKWGAGDREAFCPLIPLLYDEPHQVAHHYLQRSARVTHSKQRRWYTKPIALRGAPQRPLSEPCPFHRNLLPRKNVRRCRDNNA